MVKVGNINEMEFLDELLIQILLSEQRENLLDVIPGLPYMYIDQVCNLLEITLPTLNKYREVYQLPYIKIGRRIYYREADIWNLLESANYQPSELKYRRIGDV